MSGSYQHSGGDDDKWKNHLNRPGHYQLPQQSQQQPQPVQASLIYQPPQHHFNQPDFPNAQQLKFQNVEPSMQFQYPEANYSANPYLQTNANFSASIFTPIETAAAGMATPGTLAPNEFNDFENEPPLLEELGINLHHILQKTLLVLNPFRHSDIEVLQDTDLAGPFVFCVTFGALLLLAGKVSFSYIYGIGVIGCLSIYFLLYEMAMSPVTITFVVSVLGYCLLPIVVLSSVNVFLSLQGIIGTMLALLAIAWCSFSSSKLFVSALSMTNQLPLVIYPCALLYSVFALITVF